MRTLDTFCFIENFIFTSDNKNIFSHMYTTLISSFDGQLFLRHLFATHSCVFPLSNLHQFCHCTTEIPLAVLLKHPVKWVFLAVFIHKMSLLPITVLWVILIRTSVTLYIAGRIAYDQPVYSNNLGTGPQLCILSLSNASHS